MGYDVDPTGVFVYGGTVQDVLFFYEWAAFPMGWYAKWFSFHWNIIPVLIDLPLSVAADTILLPMTITQQIVGRPDPADESSPAESGR